MTFVDVHRSLVELVIDGGKLTKTLGCQNKFDTVASELVDVVSTSQLGRQLFQEQLAATVADKVAKVIMEDVGAFFSARTTVKRKATKTLNERHSVR